MSSIIELCSFFGLLLLIIIVHDFPTLELPRQNRAQPAACGGLEFQRRDPTRQSSVVGAIGEANPRTKGVAARWMASQRAGVGYDLDITMMDRRWRDHCRV